ncbi:MAG: hypothetical protein QG557_689 [Pseudomonadota bacterium]|nr:hypothetical protein [Pseudomonadota bacterium]
MSEIIFLVEDDEEGGFIAKALSESIYTQADTIEELRVNIKDAVSCHFSMRKIID